MQVSKGQTIIGALIVIIFGVIMALYLFRPEAIPSQQQGWQMLLGALISQFTIVVGWFFGSSKGSSDKTSLMSRKP
jgi:hypothetical protein